MSYRSFHMTDPSNYSQRPWRVTYRVIFPSRPLKRYRSNTYRILRLIVTWSLRYLDTCTSRERSTRTTKDFTASVWRSFYAKQCQLEYLARYILPCFHFNQLYRLKKIDRAVCPKNELYKSQFQSLLRKRRSSCIKKSLLFSSFPASLANITLVHAL